jgi:hypothetical protein
VIVVRIHPKDCARLFEEMFRNGGSGDSLTRISMKPEFAREVMECLPTGRTLFRYAKDDYAFLLLQ